MKTYDLIKVNEGYILQSEREKYLMYESKFNVPYYLKQVLPTVQFISGLFYDKTYKIYRGKNKQGNKVVVRLYTKTATIDI